MIAQGRRRAGLAGRGAPRWCWACSGGWSTRPSPTSPCCRCRPWSSLALLALGGLVEGTAGAWLLPGRTFREALADGVRAIPAFALALVLLASVWWIGGRVDAWHSRARGEIDAWFIATFNDPDATWPHRVIEVVVFVIRAIVGVSLAVACSSRRLEGGLAAPSRGCAGSAPGSRAIR